MCRRLFVLLVVLSVISTACGGPTPVDEPAVSAGGSATGSEDEATGDVQGPPVASGDAGPARAVFPGPPDLDGLFPPGSTLALREIARRPHDSTAYTQGLEFDGEQLFESRGLFADDEPVTLTEIDPANGTAIRSVERDTTLGDYFAEGLTVVDDRIIQLTWRANTALVYDRATLEKVGEYRYEGQGWGICDQPDRLIMSNGTEFLTHRDPDTFEVLREVEVTLDGIPYRLLNELECVGDLVVANVFTSDRILVIEPDSGEIRSVIDASAVADDAGRYVDGPERGSVLNGVAYDPLTDTWLITGKRWPFMFEVAFDCVDGCVESSAEKTHFVRQSLPGQDSSTAGR